MKKENTIQIISIVLAIIVIVLAVVYFTTNASRRGSVTSPSSVAENFLEDWQRAGAREDSTLAGQIEAVKSIVTVDFVNSLGSVEQDEVGTDPVTCAPRGSTDIFLTRSQVSEGGEEAVVEAVTENDVAIEMSFVYVGDGWKLSNIVCGEDL